MLEYLNHPTELIEQPLYNVGCCHVAFQVKSAEEAYERLARANIKLISKPMLSSEKIANVCFCLDPDNVRIELVEMLVQ